MAQSCGVQLIDMKNKIHVDWFALQDQQSKTDGRRLLGKGLYDAIVGLGESAAAIAQDCTPVTDELRVKINEGVADLKATRLLDLTRELPAYARVPGSYQFSGDTARRVLAVTINELANNVHNAGYSALGTDGRYAGCAIAHGTSLETITAPLLAYCEGVPAPSRPQANIYDVREPDATVGKLYVEQHLGQHRVKWSFEETEKEDTYEAEADYAESGDGRWRVRGDGVRRKLESLGLECENAGRSYECKGTVTGKDSLRQAARFLASLHDVDLMGDSDCIDEAIEEGWTEAGETVADLKENAWKEWSRDAKDMVHCEPEEEEEEEAKETAEERRQRHIEEAIGDLEFHLHAIAALLAPEADVTAPPMSDHEEFVEHVVSLVKRRNALTLAYDDLLGLDAQKWHAYEGRVAPAIERLGILIDEAFRQGDYLEAIWGRDRSVAQWSPACEEYANHVRLSGGDETAVSNAMSVCYGIATYQNMRMWGQKNLKEAVATSMGATKEGLSEKGRQFICERAMDVASTSANRFNELAGVCANLPPTFAARCQAELAADSIQNVKDILVTLEGCSALALARYEEYGAEKWHIARVKETCDYVARSEEGSAANAACQKFLAGVQAIHDRQA